MKPIIVSPHYFLCIYLTQKYICGVLILKISILYHFSVFKNQSFREKLMGLKYTHLGNIYRFVLCDMTKRRTPMNLCVLMS